MLNFYLLLLSDPEDQKKMTLLYEKYRQLMFTAARQIVRDDFEAEDVTHEAFVQLAQNLHKVHDADSIETRSYLVAIVRNLCFFSLRRKKKQNIVPLPQTEEEDGADRILDIPDQSPLPAQQVQDEIFVESLRKLIEQLRPIHRDVLILYYIEDRSVAEVAQTLGISRNAVYKRIENGRKTLCELLEKEGYCAEDL